MVTPDEKEYYVVCTRCEHKFTSEKDPKAVKERDRPQCAECGSRMHVVDYKEWKKLTEEIFPDTTQKLEEILQTTGVSQKRIDLIMSGYTMNLGYQNPDGLFHFLTTIGVDHRKAKVACEMFFGQQRLAAAQTQRLEGAVQPPVVVVDQHGRQQVMQPSPQTHGAAPQLPIIFMQGSQQQPQGESDKIVQRPMVVEGKVQKDSDGTVLMETIMPAHVQQDPVERMIGALQKMGIVGKDKTDELKETKKMFVETIDRITDKIDDKDKTEKILEAIKETRPKKEQGESETIRDLRDRINELASELKETKTKKEIDAVKADFDKKLADIKKDRYTSELTDQQFQMKTQKETVGNITDFGKEIGKIIAQETGKIITPILEMQRTQFNAQMMMTLRASEMQQGLRQGALTDVLMSPSSGEIPHSGDLTQTMQKIKERAG